MQLQLQQLKQQIEAAKEASVRAREEALLQQREQLEKEKNEVSVPEHGSCSAEILLLYEYSTCARHCRR